MGDYKIWHKWLLKEILVKKIVINKRKKINKEIKEKVKTVTHLGGPSDQRLFLQSEIEHIKKIKNNFFYSILNLEKNGTSSRVLSFLSLGIFFCDFLFFFAFGVVFFIFFWLIFSMKEDEEEEE